MAEITSRPYRPVRCCERCVFGTGQHSILCAQNQAEELAIALDLVAKGLLDADWDQSSEGD